MATSKRSAGAPQAPYEGKQRAKALRLRDHDVSNVPLGTEPGKPRAKPLRARAHDRGRQVMRLFTLLRAIERSRRGLSIVELHRDCGDGCTTRTIYRDVKHLCDAGFPLIETAGRWSVDLDAPGASLCSTPMRPSEVLGLLLCEDLLRPIGSSELGQGQQELRRRLYAGLTPEGRAMISEQRATLRATYAAPLTDGSLAHLSVIEDACEREHCIEISYAGIGKEPSQRVVEPHLFWFHAGRPYLVGFCRSSNEFRTFALQRVQGAKLLDEDFERRSDFNPEEFTRLGFGVLHGEQHAIELEFSSDVAHLARERVWHSGQEVAPAEGSGVTLKFTAGGLPEIAAWVASFGGKVRALAPAKLVEAVRALHAAGLAAHSGARPQAVQVEEKTRLTRDVKGPHYGGGDVDESDG